jgi:hypothetical protein
LGGLAVGVFVTWLAVAHHGLPLIPEILGYFSEGEEIETAGDSFFIVFTQPCP